MTNAVVVSAPLTLRFAGIAWPLASERVSVRVSPLADPTAAPASRVEAAWGARLRVVADLPAPVEDEGPLGPAAEALRAAPLPGGRGVRLEVQGARPGRPGFDRALRRAALAALHRVGGPPPAPPRDPLEAAVDAGAPHDDRGPVDLAAERLAWLSRRLVLFDDPFVPPEPPHEDHATGGVDPRLVLLAEPAALAAALTGHGVPDRPVWREEQLDRALRAAGLLARFRAAPGIGLAFVEPGRRPELLAALADHGLAPAPCELGGPGVTVTPSELEHEGHGGSRRSRENVGRRDLLGPGE